jgi:hypothetical protein
MSFLTRKYPFRESRHWLRDCIGYGVVIWAILWLLQPFGFSEAGGNKFLISAIFGLCTTCCCALYGRLVFASLPKRITPWRIWHQGCALLGLILFIAVCNFLLFAFIYHFPITFQLFLIFLYWTLVIGILMCVLTIGIDYNRYMRERMEALLSNTTEAQKDVMVTIRDNNVRGNDLSIPINSLLYVEAQKNNVSVCCLKDGKPTCVEVHTTLTAVVEDLKAYDNIFQCHRSFVVNVNNITSARGNSNGYQLRLGSSPGTIPVSRSFVPRLKAYIT